MDKAENIVYETALQYVECEVLGKKINIPYMINYSNRYCSPLTKGKAPIDEIIQEFETKIKQDKQQIALLSPNQIKQMMQSYGIGIDCSGFAYHILNSLVRQKTKKDLNRFLIRFPGMIGVVDKAMFKNKRYQKISAAVLTSDLNTIKINNTSDIRVGDLIRMTHQGYEGKHPLVVVKVTPTSILYAHSSEYVETNGVHFGKILIHNVGRNLYQQEWSEKTTAGKNYGKDAFRVDLGDSVRRLKCLGAIVV